MTLSIEKRKAAVERCLSRLADLCGDEQNIWFGDQDLVPAAPFRTTIRELEDLGLVEQKVMSSDPEPYVLTLKGWVKSHELSGRFTSAEFQARRERLCAAMKRAVDGRRDTILLDWRELATSANVPDGWLWNILEAQVLHAVDPNGRHRVRFEQGTVWIEPTFGQKPVDLE